MPRSKLSIPRLLRFITLLKEGVYPNHPRLQEEMQKWDMEDSFEISQKTLQRDVRFLVKEYNAPILYDYKKRGYYLTDPTWQVDLPLKASDLAAAALGARLAESRMPQFANSGMDNVLGASLYKIPQEKDTNPDLDALLARGPIGNPKLDIFATVYQGWLKRTCLDITYQRGADGKVVELIVEPHMLALFQGKWYVKTRRLNDEPPPCSKDGVTMLAIHRILAAKLRRKTFKNDEKMFEEPEHGRLFNLPTVKNVQMRLTGKGILYGREAFSGIDFLKNDGDSITIMIPEVEEFRVVNFVMTWPGEAVVEAPSTLVKHICDDAMKIIMAHQDFIRKLPGK